MATLRALVIGGGIGGLTAALALRAIGADVTVYERAASLESVQTGGGIHLWSNALQVLRHIEIESDVRAVGAEVEQAEFRAWGGPVLARWPVGAISRKVGAPTVGVSRADLHPVLTRAVGADQIALNAQFESFAEDHGGVTVRFTDGRTDHAELLIGADGISSVIRSQIHGQHPQRYSGYTVWQAIIDYPVDQAPRDHFRVTWGRGMRFAYYGVGNGQLYWFGVANAPARERDPAEGKVELLLDRFTGWPEPTRSIIAATPDGAISRIDMRDRPPLKQWGAGRVTLLGDAAHPMTFNVGQGACQAIEDAGSLVRHLRHQPDVPAALRAYEAERIKRTTPIVNLAWKLGVLGRWEHPGACRLRDLILRGVLSTIALRGHERDMAYDAWDDRFVTA